MGLIGFLRLMLSLSLMVTGFYLIYDLFSNGFNFLVILGSVVCFTIVHYIKPKRDAKQESDIFIKSLLQGGMTPK
ncbi:MAG: hypothetical protein OEY19_13970 [Gammaproteobacteria bacterium]|nr:hypothetical protein [Gammaproteobacteria bacterium]